MESRKHPLANQVTAVVLAAGKGTRFQHPEGVYKLAHEVFLNNKTLPILSHTLQNLNPIAAHCICIIDPEKRSELSFLSDHESVQVIENPLASLGMAESLKKGAALIPPNHGVMVCLADMPFIKSTTYQMLIDKFKQHNGLKIVRPTFDGIDGHPVIFPHHYCSALLQLSGDEGAKSLIKESDLLRVDCNDEGVLMDTDYYAEMVLG